MNNIYLIGILGTFSFIVSIAFIAYMFYNLGKSNSIQKHNIYYVESSYSVLKNIELNSRLGNKELQLDIKKRVYNDLLNKLLLQGFIEIIREDTIEGDIRFTAQLRVLKPKEK